MNRILLAAAVACCGLLAAACGGSPTEPGGTASTDTVVTIGSSLLVINDAPALTEQAGRIEQVVRDTYSQARARVPLERVTILVFAGTSTVIPEIGIGGRADTGTVRLTFDPASAHWPATIDTALSPLLAHELHHVARFRAVGFSDNLLEAAITEGLADHFTVELLDAATPIWAVALRGPELEEWIERARAVWLQGSYDHDAWFFGTSPQIPRWAGYSIGFELVRRYLAANPSATASGLHSVGATTVLEGA